MMRCSMNATVMALALVVSTALPSLAQEPRTEPSDTASPLAAGARIGFVDFNRVASVSKQWQVLAGRLEEIRVQRGSAVEARSKEVAALETKLTQSAGVLNDTALDQLRRQFERAQVDFQRFTQDAQADVEQVRVEVERAFMQKAFPVVEAVATEKSLWAVFSVSESGLLWRDATLDLSDEVARRIDEAP